MKPPKRLFPMMDLFKTKPVQERTAENRARLGLSGEDVMATPTWWGLVFSWILAAVFCWLAHRFFLWCPPYLQEVVKNLKGLPYAWFIPILFWGERGLMILAGLSALYHTLWKFFTHYWLTTHDIQIGSWFPIRRVQSIPYGAVRKVGFRQSLLGLLLRYGHVEVDTGSPLGPVLLLNCPQPAKFLKTLRQRVESALQSYTSQNKN